MRRYLLYQGIVVVEHAIEQAKKRCGMSAMEIACVVARAMDDGSAYAPSETLRKHSVERWVAVGGPGREGTAVCVIEGTRRVVVTVRDARFATQGERVGQVLRHLPFAGLGSERKGK